MNHNRILFLCLFIAGCLPLHAQIGELRNNWAVGVNGGANMNKVSFTSEVRVKELMQIGPTFGVTARYISEKYFAMICGVQIELNYSQRGWKEDPEENPYAYERKMNYLEIPFLAHLAIGKERGVQFFINAGPQMNYLLNEKEVYGGDWQSYPYQQHGKAAEKRFDYGIVGGGGLEIRTGAGNFLLEGRYYFGLGDFFNNSKRDYFERSAHTSISVRLTYLFDITR